MKPWLTFLGDIIRASLKKKFFVQCCYPGTTGNKKSSDTAVGFPGKRPGFSKPKSSVRLLILFTWWSSLETNITHTLSRNADESWTVL